MREEKGRKQKEKENDNEGRSERGKKKGKEIMLRGLSPPKPKMLATSLVPAVSIANGTNMSVGQLLVFGLLSLAALSPARSCGRYVCQV